MAANAHEVGISIDSPTDSLNGNGSAHTSLVSSYQGRHYGTVNKGQWKANGYILHTITSTDTLQGIALKYKVPVSEIQRANWLFSNESIHKNKELKIPYCSPSPQSSPLTFRKTETNSESVKELEISSSLEEEVKQKPKPEDGGEKNILSLLNAVDEQLKVSQDFVDKLATKNSQITRAPDAYNRFNREEQRQTKEEEWEDSFSDKIKRTFKRPTVWTPGKDRDKVEDELFQL